MHASLIGASLMSLGCTTNEESLPNELRVSAIPDQSSTAVHLQHDLLVEHVCRSINIRCVWVEGKSYDDVVDRIGRNEIDFAYLGGAMFVLANHRYGAKPLAIRDIELRFTSAVVVAANSDFYSLRDLRNQSVLFGSRRSTSGHIMPRHFFMEQGIEPESFFRSIDYSQGHDDTLRRVANGEFSAGVVNGAIATNIISNGIVGGLRVIWETPPYVDYVWAARSGLPKILHQQLTDEFLNFRLNEPTMRAALDQELAKGYLPAYISDFTTMTLALREQGLLVEAK